MAQPFKIIISGEGGQGVLSIAKTIAYAAWTQGRESMYVPYFSTEKRGGVSIAYAQVSDTPIAFPKFDKADLWVVLSQRAVDRIYSYLKEDSIVIANSHLVKDFSRIDGWKPYAIDAEKIAREQLKKPRTFNMVVMGAMLNFVPGLSIEGFGKALEKTFHSKYEKDPALKELNEKAFHIGYDLVASSVTKE